MAFSFRHRMFLGLLGLGTLPLTAALLGLVLAVRSAGSPAGARSALDEIAASAQQTVASLDTTRLTEVERQAVRAHLASIAQRTTLARRADLLTGAAAGALAAVIVVAAALVVALSVVMARRWSRYTSAPIEELVDWVRRIERGAALPADASESVAPEFDALRKALRETADALDRMKRQEIERERLQAFRETARRVAHEMRNPVGAALLAAQRIRGDRSLDARAQQATAVVEDELRRLERMAQEFSDFGRLPEGPESDVDVAELLRSVVESTLPADHATSVRAPTDLVVRGYYEPLRRAIANLLQNARDAAETGAIQVTAALDDAAPGWVRIVVADRGPGVPPELRERIFDPYVTTKTTGTGLGLVMVRQIVIAHGGDVTLEETHGGGASFVISLPGKPT
jgi:two-component system, NtrC family, nitrogen regulation sensor histidine kinase NtrY